LSIQAFDADTKLATIVELKLLIVVTNDDDVAVIELDADKNDAVALTSTLAILLVNVLNEDVAELMTLTRDCDNNLSDVANDADVVVKAFDEETNDKTTLELNELIELEAERKLAVADTSTEVILLVRVLNELVVETITLTKD